MQLVDFDGDGDLDVLVTNGDSFDDFLLKPYHGIQWLENEGRYPVSPLTRWPRWPEPIARVAVDLDGDGDLDVVAAAMIALAREGAERTLPSVVWLERIGPKEFKRHTLEVGTPTHASLDAADYDGDGDIDLVIGNLSPQRPVPTWVEVWENKHRTDAVNSRLQSQTPDSQLPINPKFRTPDRQFPSAMPASWAWEL